MKKITAVSCVTLSVLFALFSCKSTSNDNIVDNSQNDYLTATVGLTPFSVTGGTIGVYANDTLGFEVTGATTSNSTLSAIAVYIKSYPLALGKYNINPSNGTEILYTKTGIATPIYSTSGTITVTAVTSSSAKGTFSCTLSDSSTITNGKFSVIY